MSQQHTSHFSRRHVLQAALLAGIGAALPRSMLAAEVGGPLITKAIPSTGEKIPLVGIGTNNFKRIPYENIHDMLKRMNELGGSVIDTAAAYGDSEVRISKALSELGLSNRMFIATKFNAPGVFGGTGKASAELSLQRLPTVDLMFIHDLVSVEPMMPVLQDLKKQRRVRYIGITTVTPSAHADTAEYMRKYPMDFVQVDYSLGDRAAERDILPLAFERKIAVMVARPLGGGANSGAVSLMNQIGGRQLPDWAGDFGIKTWGQFFLKYVVSHPAVTCAIPGSSQVAHVEDNQAAGHGRLPDAAMRKKMEEFWVAKA